MNRRIRRKKSERGLRIEAREAEETSPEQQKPVFSLSYLKSGYCVSNCTRDQKASFADTLRKLSQLTWVQLKLSPHHGLGYEKIPRDQINIGIPNHIREDVNFIAFRFFNRAPMIGYRDGRTFYIIWIDPSFCVYNH